ncbi:MAG TPA: SdpI family protein [Humisphaera sp.]|jgi:uncharacterized membrane protein|nr:SdpI family protein [Humisphaera sp.]
MIPRVHVYIIAAIILTGFAISAAAYSFLPNPTPIHWNIHGQADRYGSPWVNILATPLASAFVAALCAWLPKLGPRKSSFEQFSKIYGRMIVALVGMLLCIHIAILLKSAGRHVAIERVFPIMIGVLLAILGNWMGKIRRNFYVGIRTPWTLASDLVWERTHRVGGHLMVAIGLAAALATLLPHPLAGFAVLIGGVLLFTIWALVYSCLLYQRVGHADETAGG